MNKIDKMVTLKPFVGLKHLLVLGEGEITFVKSIDNGESFYPVTDEMGSPVSIKSVNGVYFNACMENSDGTVLYGIRVESGTAAYGVK